ncbi:hypothetical protein HMPREF1400_01655, partial [Helicobacter pylori GAM119Bi]
QKKKKNALCYNVSHVKILISKKENMMKKTLLLSLSLSLSRFCSTLKTTAFT